MEWFFRLCVEKRESDGALGTKHANKLQAASGREGQVAESGAVSQDTVEVGERQRETL
jgi:hypothetical protein